MSAVVFATHPTVHPFFAFAFHLQFHIIISSSILKFDKSISPIKIIRQMEIEDEKILCQIRYTFVYYRN